MRSEIVDLLRNSSKIIFMFPHLRTKKKIIINKLGSLSATCHCAYLQAEVLLNILRRTQLKPTIVSSSQLISTITVVFR